LVGKGSAGLTAAQKTAPWSGRLEVLGSDTGGAECIAASILHFIEAPEGHQGPRRADRLAIYKSA